MEEKEESTKAKTVYTPEVKKDKVLAYLKEKYNEEFVPKFMSESGWGQGHDEIWLYPKNGTEEEMFVVWGTILDDGSYAMRDGYFGIIIKDEYEAVMTDFVKEIYPDFKLYTSFVNGSPCPDRLNKGTKVNELYNVEEYPANISYTRWREILTNIKNDKELCGLIITNPIDEVRTKTIDGKTYQVGLSRHCTRSKW